MEFSDKGGVISELVTWALRSAMAEGSNTNLLVMHFPFLYMEPHITIDESPRHVSFAGKRELAMNSGYTVASLLPQAVAVHAFRNELKAAPSRNL